MVSEKTLEISWTAKTSKQSILKETNPKYSLEGLVLKLQCFGHLLQIDGETMEIVTCFIFLDSKITEDGDCSHEMKRCLLLGRKAMTKLESILKSRSITLPTEVHLIKAMVFPVVMYRCESWTIKKAEG